MYIPSLNTTRSVGLGPPGAEGPPHFCQPLWIGIILHNLWFLNKHKKCSFAKAADSAANNFPGVLARGGDGYNYQMGSLVIGGQAEWDWTNERGGEFFNCPANGSFFSNCNMFL
jgi:hypothetical protein